jgi:hypothetical protein
MIFFFRFLAGATALDICGTIGVSQEMQGLPILSFIVRSLELQFNTQFLVMIEYFLLEVKKCTQCKINKCCVHFSLSRGFSSKV